MRCVLAIVPAIALTGCATGAGVTGMTPEQLEQFVKIKDATVTCVKGVYAGVTITTTFVNVDSVKASPASLTVKDDCSITLTGKGTTP